MSNQVCNTVMLPVEEYEALRKQVEELTQYGVKLDNWNDTLQEQLAAMTQERDSFRQSLADMYDERTARLEEAQAEIERLRDAAKKYDGYEPELIKEFIDTVAIEMERK
jgi:hypothetical protein